MKLMKLGHRAGRKSGLGLMLGAALGAVAGFSSGTAAEKLTTLYSFAGPPADGGASFAGLIADASGNLYGTTFLGGGSDACSGGCGTVLKVTPSGHETVLHSFKGGNDGASPAAGLIADASGNLYGTTENGGGTSGCSGGCGTVFKLTPSGHETVLHRFSGGTDGANPVAGLIADASGNLYGTTENGGGAIGCSGGCGTVFKLTPSGTETVLHRFTGSDGANPFAALIADGLGNLHGTTFFGGASGNGTVFKLTPSGTEIVLYSFTGGSDGENPLDGLIADAAGNLYGMTNNGGAGTYGTVFKLMPSGNLTVLHSFTGGSDGAFPGLGSLIADAAGNLYGMTVEGGGGSSSVCVNIGCGTVFKVTPSETETVLHRFTGLSDGDVPHAGLIADAAGNLYGTTLFGGGSSVCGNIGCGTVFKIVGSGFVVFAGTPGKPNCYDQSVSALAVQYGGLAAATAALGEANVQALQNAIAAYCAG